MDILVLNGSPKGERSNTFKITTAFLDGLSSKQRHNINIVHICEREIHHCRGCFNCWTKTPGSCVIKDDMGKLLEQYINADLIIWSFPLYYFGMPSIIKAFLDRTLPTSLPYMSINEDGTTSHPPRYDLSHQRHVLISTCGFYTVKNNFDALLRQFEILFGDKLTTIICPEGELFSTPQLKARTSEYLSYAKQAGEEFAEHGRISNAMQNRLSELLYPPERYLEMANASWEVIELSDDVVKDKSFSFMRQMAAAYNPQSYTKDTVIEFYYKDLDKTYQLCLTQEKCILKTDDFVPYTTRIETDFDLWLQISQGKVNGAAAMMERRYRVLGNFETMLKLDEYFGNRRPVSEVKSKTNMNILLFQWIALWVMLPINKVWAGVAGIGICSVIHLLEYKYRLTIYDKISIVLVSFLSMLALFNASSTLIICLSYLFFGLMWLISCFVKIPLTAYYSSNNYNGDEAFENPLFIKTNRIITAAWGLLYLVITIYTYFLMESPLSHYVGFVNLLVPSLMGILTVWFAKWYPAKIARG